MSSDQLAGWTKEFDHIDKDGDGSISAEEVIMTWTEDGKTFDLDEVDLRRREPSGTVFEGRASATYVVNQEGVINEGDLTYFFWCYLHAIGVAIRRGIFIGVGAFEVVIVSVGVGNLGS